MYPMLLTDTSSMVSISIKRVVSVFILRRKGDSPNNLDVAVFRRCPTMPTFANHWAGISGSIEESDASPLEAAMRELQEETNVCDILKDQTDDTLQLQSCIKAGLYLDVSKNTRGAFGGRIIRVYPFALTLPHTMQSIDKIEMRGTEHDAMKFVSLKEFMQLTPCVPGLQTAFHHATSGSFLKLPADVRSWESDRVNGAAYLARKAVSLAGLHYRTLPSIAQSIAILRPSMVPIVNTMKEFDDRSIEGAQSEGLQSIATDILQSLELEAERCVDLAVDAILKDYKASQSTTLSKDYVIGTFSRSSTLRLTLERVLQQSTSIRVICSQSAPGDEGELMANDIPNATWLDDYDFQHHIREGKMNLVIVGADCILSNHQGVVNKIGTNELARICKYSNVPIKCFADRWKLWDDIYPPPLERIFEVVSIELLDDVVVPTGPG